MNRMIPGIFLILIGIAGLAYAIYAIRLGVVLDRSARTHDRKTEPEMFWYYTGAYLLLSCVSVGCGLWVVSRSFLDPWSGLPD